MDGFVFTVLGATAGVIGLTALAISARYWTNYGERRKEMDKGLRNISEEFAHLKPGRDVTGENYHQYADMSRYRMNADGTKPQPPVRG